MTTRTNTPVYIDLGAYPEGPRGFAHLDGNCPELRHARPASTFNGARRHVFVEKLCETCVPVHLRVAAALGVRI